MKKILLLLLAIILSSTFCKSQYLVDTNYSKYLKLSVFAYDENQNGEFDDIDYLYEINGSIILDYKDFNSAGNLLEIKIDMGKDFIFEKRYSDIKLYRVEEDKKTGYIAKNKYNEKLFAIMVVPEENSTSYFIFIYDMTIIK